jgi:hypothetical protein
MDKEFYFRPSIPYTNSSVSRVCVLSHLIHLAPSHLYIMVSSESETDWSDHSAVGSYADRIRRNDKSLTKVGYWESDFVEILDALKNNTVVKEVSFQNTDTLLQVNHEAFVKLSEVMRCNTSVESLIIGLTRGLLRERLFATMATSGGWSSIQELVLDSGVVGDDDIEPLSLREAEHISSFILQSENLLTLRLEMAGDETAPIVEALSRTKVQSLQIVFHETFSLLNGGRQLAAAFERCTCITELQLNFPAYNHGVEMEFFQILFIESIPKMMGLKHFELQIRRHVDRQFFNMLGQSIGEHQGEIEELRLRCYSISVNSSSIIGLAPALRRLKVIRLDGYTPLNPQQMGELSAIVGACDSLEEFGYNLHRLSGGMSAEYFKAICQLLSRFPSLKRVTQDRRYAGDVLVNLREESRFVAFLRMVQTSKTIEHVPPFQCRNAEDEAAIKHHCCNNMMHNRFELIRKKGLLAATVPSNAWPLILKEFTDMPDVLYYC